MGRDESRLSVVVCTVGPLSPVHRTLLERLARDPALWLRSVVVERAGAAWAPDGRRLHALKVAMYERFHPPLNNGDGYAGLERATGVVVHEVESVHDAHAAALLSSLRAQVGLVIGGAAPAAYHFDLGTLALRVRGRGGSVAVSVEHAAKHGRDPVVVAETVIAVEDGDTEASLRIKTDLTGAQLCQDIMSRMTAAVRTGGRLPAVSAGDAAPADAVEESLALAPPRERRSPVARTRLALQYGLLMPQLGAVRDRLVRERRAPVCIFYYHLVSNRPLNHMCLGLEQFVEQVDFLLRHFPIVSLDEAAARLGSGKNEEVAAALTFDDGYRDNAWAIEYLRYFEIPACFFVSIGHVLDGSAFEHDRRRGFTEAAPMSPADLRKLTSEGFLIGSHGVHHEDFGTLDASSADGVLAESRRLITEVSGQVPEHFSFPKGKRGTNINADAFALALNHYSYVHSAYGGYNFPVTNRRHFLRVGSPADTLDLAMIMDGYTGGRDVLAGNAWGLKTDALRPY
jgi:peptidoglycan/xylan/chitin deacetylase (PgdA/CDA1 family)